MITIQLYVNALIAIIAFKGILTNYRNFIVVLLGIEILLLSVNLNFAMFSLALNDITGQLCALFVLTVAAAESAIGLAIVVLYYRLKNNIYILDQTILKK